MPYSRNNSWQQSYFNWSTLQDSDWKSQVEQTQIFQSVSATTDAPKSTADKSRDFKGNFHQWNQDSGAFLWKIWTEYETWLYQYNLKGKAIKALDTKRQKWSSYSKVGGLVKTKFTKQLSGMLSEFCLLTSWRVKEWEHLLIRKVFWESQPKC